MEKKVEGEQKEFAELRKSIFRLMDAEQERRIKSNAKAMQCLEARVMAIVIGRKHQLTDAEAVALYDGDFKSDPMSAKIKEFEAACEKIEKSNGGFFIEKDRW